MVYTRITLYVFLVSLALSIATASVHAEVFVYRLAPLAGFTSSPAFKVVWLPCNGSLVPFYQLVYAAPPGVNVTLELLDVRYKPGFFEAIPAAIATPGLEGRSYTPTCRAVVIQEGVWRGVTILDVMVAGFIVNRGVELVEAKVVVSADKVSRGRSLTLWEYDVVRRVATVLYPSGWVLSKKPYEIGVIVLTRKVLLPAVEAWASEVEKRGLRVVILTVDDICSEYSGVAKSRGLRYAIREAIKKVYESAPNIYRYLLIVGDDSGRYWRTRITSCSMLEPWEVPTAYFYNPAWSEDVKYSHSGYFVPSDIYYVTFDGDWDANGNGILGEYPQDVKAYDPYPELLAARVPARSVDDAERALLTYVRLYPLTNDIVLTGSVLYYYNELAEEHVSQGDTLAEGLYRYLLSQVPWLHPVRLYEHYPVDKVISKPQQINGNLTRQEMITVLQEERGVTVAVFAHGGPQCLWRKIWVNDTNGDGKPEENEVKWEPFLCAVDAPLVQPQFMYIAAACLTAYFDNPDVISLGEALELQGSLYIGWNRVTFTILLPPSEQMNPSYWCCSARMAYLAYKYLLAGGEAHRVGDSLLEAIVTYVTEEPLDQQGIYGNVSRRVFFAFTVLGDPTRIVYSSPTLFNSFSVVIPATPGSIVNVTLRLYALARNEPLSGKPIYVYRYLGEWRVSDTPLVTVYTDEAGYVKVALTAPIGGARYIAYYPGSTLPPITEPAASLIEINTSIKPWVLVQPSTLAPFKPFRIVGCGFPPYTPLDMLIGGVWITRLYTNATGCFDYSIIPPPWLPPGEFKLRVVDTQIPTLYAETSIAVPESPLVNIWSWTRDTRALVYTLLQHIRYVENILHSLNEKLDTLNESIVEVLNATGKTVDVVKEMREKINTIVSGIGRLASTLDQLAESLESLEADQEELKVMQSLTERRLQAIEYNLTEISVKLHALAVELTKAKELNADVLEKLVSLRAMLRDVERIVESLSDMLPTRLKSLEKNLESLQAELGRMEARIEEVNNSVTRLAVELRESNAILKNIAETVGLNSRRVSEIASTVVRLEGHVEALSTETSKVAAKLAVLDSSLARVNESVEKVGFASLAAAVLAAGALAAGLVGVKARG